MIETIVASLGAALAFGGICFLIGGAIPRGFLFRERSLLWQRLAVGWALLIVVLRFPLREDLPPSLALVLLAVLALLALTNDFRQRHAGATLAASGQRPSRNVLFGGFLCAVPLLPLLAILYFPLLADHAVFYRNFGPDLIGNLVSTSYVAERRGFGELLAAFSRAIGGFDWWHSTHPDPWRLLDMRDSIAIEFFPRSVRWGHAVLASFIDLITGQREWFGFFVIVLFSLLLFPLLLIDECRLRKIPLPRAVLVATLAVTGQNYVLMHYEGIGVQLLATPFLLFLVFVSRETFLSKISLGQRFVYALLASAMMTTFGEGIQLLAVFVTLLVVLHFAAGGLRLQERTVAPREAAIGVLATAGFLVLLSPALSFDFASWSYMRLKDHFDGGALHFNYSLASIMTQFPYVRVSAGGGPSSIHLLVSAGTASRLLEASVLLAIGVLLYLRKGVHEFLALAGVIFLVVLTGHRYAIWKTCVLFQPLALILLAQVNWGARMERAKRWAALGMLVLALLGQSVLMWQYHKHAIKVTPSQFAISKSGLTGKRYAVITPSQADSYLYLATVGPLNWLNGGPRQFGLPADFSPEADRNLQVVLYFDCDAEGSERCAEIRKANPQLAERTLLGTAMKAGDFLDKSGLVAAEKLQPYVKANFGVNAK